MNKQIKSIIFFVSYILLFNNNGVSAQQNNLFTIDPQVRSSQDAIFPIAQSLEEWNITINLSQINSNNDSFNLILPNNNSKNQILSVVRTSFSQYASKNSQWAGDIITGNAKTGYIIVNKVNGSIYAVIMVNDTKYEIYSDNQVGSRLVRVGSVSVGGIDYVENDIKGVNETIPNINILRAINGTSIVDVQILIDDDLNFAGSPIFNIIAAEEMNANYILSQSGVNGDGVPLRLNFLTPEFIDIPTSLQVIDSTHVAFNDLTGGITGTSINLINRYNASNADIVALYIPFDPQPFPVDGPSDICGLAGLPRDSSLDIQFKNSFSLLSNSCGASAFTLLHEIMHNFGSNHRSGQGLSFTSYANGIKINISGDEITTIMDCIQVQIGDDSSTISCNRIPQLSSPLVTVDGAIIGDPDNADNVRFISECTASRCRREELANRVNGSNPVDLIPTISILTPSDDDMIKPTNSFTLTANANDDNTGVSVKWEITKNGQSILSANGTGVNFSFTTSVFSTVGQYIVSATATDSIGQSRTDTNVVTVDDLVPIVNILTPIDESVIPETNSFTLTAQASDDVGVVGVNWQVSKNGVVLLSAPGVGTNYSLVTTEFNITGLYDITASVKDTIGQISTDTHSIRVKNNVSMHITIDERNHIGKYGKTPNVTVSLYNNGPDIAHNSVFNFSVKSGTGSAKISNLPIECILTSPKNKPELFIRQYQCNIPAILAGSKPFEIRWDILCPARLSEGASLEFSAAFVSVDGFYLLSANDASYSYWSPVCTGP